MCLYSDGRIVWQRECGKSGERTMRWERADG